MPSTIQTFDGAPATTGDEIVCKWYGTLYPAEVTGIDEETDTPVITIYEDGVGTHTGWTYSSAPREEWEQQPHLTWFWKFPPPPA